MRAWGQRYTVLLAGAVLCLRPLDVLAVLDSCSVAATPVNFGTYDPLAASPDDASGSITVTCNVLVVGLLASWTISLSTGASGTYSPRRLSNGAGLLAYNLYTSSARTTIWGDGTGGTQSLSDSRLLVVGTNQAIYTVHGRIAAGQDEAAGAYSDVIVVTLDY